MRSVGAVAVAISPLLACLCGGASSFALLPTSSTTTLITSSSSSSSSRIARRSFASHAAETTALDDDVGSSSSAMIVDVRVLDGSERSMREAAEFMVDAFWLPSSTMMLATKEERRGRSSLVEIQARDLMDKYGERTGRRILDSIVISATTGEDGVMGGLITVEVRLLEVGRDLLSAEESERLVTRALSSLGPKQRREYKDASVIDVANRLLPPDIVAACSLSNLCVSPNSRRMGVASRLCAEAERVAREEFGFDAMHLRVEESNVAARGLYEGRLGYEVALNVDSAIALRADVDAGSFVEVRTDIVVLRKKI